MILNFINLDIYFEAPLLLYKREAFTFIISARPPPSARAAALTPAPFRIHPLHPLTRTERPG